MKLYGQQWARRDIEKRVGRIEQIGGVRRATYSEGPAAGTEVIHVRTGAGLTYDVIPSKGMDISTTAFGGVPLAWASPNGDAHPRHYDPHGAAWLRTASGGLLMTCGLRQAGMPNTDAGEELGLHGRAHHSPARHVAVEAGWQGDEYDIRISGTVEETRIFGEHLTLRRTIGSRLGENVITITDVVENRAFEPTPHMLLYHFNFGFPLLTAETRLTFPSQKVTPRDAGVPVEGYDRWEGPQAAYSERVYRHTELETDDEGWATATVHNPAFPTVNDPAPLRVELSWDATHLDRCIQWKMPGEGTHVLGIEPANCFTSGRHAERQTGTLQFLKPGEARIYRLRVVVTTS
jgi:hypothetical protein